MGRKQLFEILDLEACPQSLRDGGTDFLRWAANLGDLPEGLRTRLLGVLEATGARRIVDLCSGGAGPLPRLQRRLAEAGWHGEVVLTDKHPNLASMEHLERASGGGIRPLREPVDARAVPVRLDGLRTLFSGFHHFPPAEARRVLADAARQRQPIAVVEVVSRHPASLLSILVNGGVIAPLVMPFIRPFRVSRLLWTYVLPILPLTILWDGLVSCLRVYSPPELAALVAGLGDDTGYLWECGVEHVGPLPVTFLIGRPAG